MKGLYDLKDILDKYKEIHIGRYTLGKTKEDNDSVYFLDIDIYNYNGGKTTRSTIDFDSDFDKFVKKVEKEKDFKGCV
ncbi:MAG: hypothetical protein ACRDDY_03620 [Clostridium sp.]|uniref:hypothetical protein n=1 Tax=Clostridium sp. TaxID=1506 RepID=UPI003EE7084C